jgi:ATP-binding cassette subfamily C (CFTR/MRP) protein 1
MSYRPGLPPALKNLNLDVGRNEKVGIVGRTGMYYGVVFAFFH